MPGAYVRKGASRFLLPSVIVVVIAIAGVYILFEQTNTSPTSSSSTTSAPVVTTTSSGPQPATPVRAAVDQYFQDFNNRDVESLMNLYGFSSDVIWTGNTEGLQGGYAGAGNIRILYGATIGKTTQLSVTYSNYTEKSLSPTNTNVTMTVKIDGNSSVLGKLSGTIVATQDWYYTSGQWQIVKENWDYKTFNVEFPASATTFPQWGALREGKSPDLVSEKSFEWNAGPLLAAAIYALLASVILIAILKTWPYGRSK